MTGNISYLSEYEPFDGGYVSFGHGGGNITGKGIIKTDFKLNDDTNVLLRTPRQHNMYSIDLNNIVPHKNLTCLVAKALVDESMLWHIRLGHLNFKTMNKLVRNNLVKGLPSKCFENDHTCVACLKGKQHKASCKTKEFSNARTPQQNGVAERRNRTLIEAARTMLVDAKLPVTFWAEAVNTACYVQNKGGLILKGMKVILLGIVMHKMILKKNKIVMLMFLKEDPTATSKVPSTEQVEPAVSLIVASDILTVSSPVSTVYLDISPDSSSGPRLISKGDFNQKEALSLGNVLSLSNRFEDTIGNTSTAVTLNEVESDLSNMETSILVSPTPTFRIHKDHPKSQMIGPVDTPVQTRHKSKEMEEQSFIATIHQKTNPELLQFCLFSCFLSQEEPKKIFDALKDPSWVEAINKARLVAQGYTQEKGIDYEEFFSPVARIEAIRLFLAYALFIGFIIYQMDVKSAFLYGTIDEEVYVMQSPRFQDPKFPDKVYKVEKAMYGLHQAPRAWYGTLSKYLLDNGFQRGTIDQTLFIKKHKGEFLLVQVYVEDIIFGSSNPLLCREFEALMHDKFQMSAMGKLTFFLGLQVLQKKNGIFLSQDKYVGDILKKFGYSDVRSANTPMDKENHWGKDGPGEDVELHLYRSMIGLLMYLTASRPDIMFTVCACARHQVTPKECHLHAVKRIYRYLKGYPKLGLWYPKESLFDFVAFSDSDYGGATQDRKSTTRGCQFLGRRLILWQCKKQTIVATSTTKAEYVVASSGYGQLLWILMQIDRGGSLSSQIRASPSNEKGNNNNLILVLGTSRCLNVDVTLLKNRRWLCGSCLPIKYEDITQIDKDDIEEMDIKWNMALLSMKADRECIAPRSQDRGKRESYKQGPKEEEPAPKALMALVGIGVIWLMRKKTMLL
nr:hypothetical protein [Tanacetum cinerariifolium]